MKIRILFVFAFVVLFATTQSFAQKGLGIPFSGTEYFDPFGLLGGPPIGAILPSDSSVQCPSHEPTGNPAQPCPPGSRTHLRNFKILSRYESSTPSLASGWMTIVMNANFDADFTGPTWGTFSLALDSGGTLDGTWEGVRVYRGNEWITPLHANGFGTGSMEGTQALISDRIVGFWPMPIVYIGTVEGRLLPTQ
jgi:hypothetical protein